MYDDGPPDPEPNPCIYCEHELGENQGCDHCKLAAANRVMADLDNGTTITIRTELPRTVKYRHPSTGAEWSGRGNQPAWVKKAIAAGRSLDEFAVDGVVA